jgi:hypothetical protein
VELAMERWRKKRLALLFKRRRAGSSKPVK